MAMSYDTHMRESTRTWECVIVHKWMSRSIHINASQQTHEPVTSRICHITNFTHIYMSHGTRVTPATTHDAPHTKRITTRCNALQHIATHTTHPIHNAPNSLGATGSTLRHAARRTHARTHTQLERSPRCRRGQAQDARPLPLCICNTLHKPLLCLFLLLNITDDGDPLPPRLLRERVLPFLHYHMFHSRNLYLGRFSSSSSSSSSSLKVS